MGGGDRGREDDMGGEGRTTGEGGERQGRRAMRGRGRAHREGRAVVVDVRNKRREITHLVENHRKVMPECRRRLRFV